MENLQKNKFERQIGTFLCDWLQVMQSILQILPDPGLTADVEFV